MQLGLDCIVLVLFELDLEHLMMLGPTSRDEALDQESKSSLFFKYDRSIVV